jgi:hypothetical protein
MAPSAHQTLPIYVQAENVFALPQQLPQLTFATGRIQPQISGELFDPRRHFLQQQGGPRPNAAHRRIVARPVEV